MSIKKISHREYICLHKPLTNLRCYLFMTHTAHCPEVLLRFRCLFRLTNPLHKTYLLLYIRHFETNEQQRSRRMFSPICCQPTKSPSLCHLLPTDKSLSFITYNFLQNNCILLSSIFHIVQIILHNPAPFNLLIFFLRF
jgi:hypothetical protein